MKIKIYLILTLFIICGSINAQDWAKKAYPAVFTLKTFDDNGSLIASSNGFFVGNQGEAVSGFSPFRGAVRAIIIDSQGLEHEVKCILGANSIYDVAKFRVDISKSTPLTTNSSTATDGSQIFILPYSVKKVPTCIEGTVVSSQKVSGGYDYYTLSITATDNTDNCPIIDATGCVIGLLQRSGVDETNTEYAIGIDYLIDLKITGLSFSDKTLKETKIKKDLPEDPDQAVLSLYMATGVLDSLEYRTLIDDFILKFPTNTEGYIYRSQQSYQDNRFEDVDRDMTTCIKMASRKDEAHYNYAKFIYNKLVLKPDVSYPLWTFDKAVEEADAACKINDNNIYMQTMAEILFSAERFDESFNVYSGEIDKGFTTAEMYFGAARCKEMVGDTTACIEYLNNAIATFDKPYLKEVAPYLLSRAQILLSAGKYRMAVVDLNEYGNIMSAQINDNFYYIRAQAEVEGHLYQQALNDLTTAITKAPHNTLYYSEKASLEIRVSMFDDAIKTAKECTEVDPELSDGYLFMGLAQCLKGDKEVGIKNLQKAKDLGDPQADELIAKYGNE